MLGTFFFSTLSNGGWDSKLDIIFNKIFELNTTYGGNFRFSNEPEEKVFMNYHTVAFFFKPARAENFSFQIDNFCFDELFREKFTKS